MAVSYRLESTNWVHRDPWDPKGSQGAPNGSKEAWEAILAYFELVCGSGARSVQNMYLPTVLIRSLIRKPMRKCRMSTHGTFQALNINTLPYQGPPSNRPDVDTGSHESQRRF